MGKEKIAGKFRGGVKGLIVGSLMVALFFGFSTSSFAAQTHNVEVKVNGAIIPMYEAPAYIDGNVTYVPLRFVSDALGAEIEYESNKAPITARIDTPKEKEVKVLLNSNKVEVNGKVDVYNGTVKLQKGRTMVPLRVISEGLGAAVKWDAKSNTIEITTPWETPNQTKPATPWKPTATQKEYGAKVFKAFIWNSESNTLSFNIPKIDGTFVLSGMKQDRAAAEKITLGKDYEIINPIMFKIAVTIYTDNTMTSYNDQYQIMTYDYANQFYGTFDKSLSNSLIVLDRYNNKVPIESIYKALGIK